MSSVEDLGHSPRPGGQEHHAVGEAGGLADVVGDEQDGEAAVVPDPFELVVEQVAGHGVEGAEGFVHEHDVGVLGEGPGEGDPLVHAAGELVGSLLAEVVRWTLARSWSTRSLRSRLGMLLQLEGEGDVRATVSQGNSADSWNIRPVRPPTSTVPDVGLVEPGDQVEQSGLAAPRGADEADELAWRCLQRDPIEGVDRRWTLTVRLRDRFDANGMVAPHGGAGRRRAFRRRRGAGGDGHFAHRVSPPPVVL